MAATWFVRRAATLALCALAACGIGPDDTGAVGENAQALTAALPTVAFTASHVNANPWGLPGCGGFIRHIWGQEPAATGRYPVYVHFVGLGGSYTSVDAETLVTEMASRGFVAASVEYTNGPFDGLDCATTLNKARCAFTASSTKSAIYKLCHRAKADCSLGIVASGHSLGGGVALLGRNFNANVQAVWTISVGSSGSTTSCLEPDARALPADRFLAFAGQSDLLTSTSALDGVTGLSCPTTDIECPNASGATFPTAGWYQVQDGQVADGSADHCYQFAGGCFGGQTTLDAAWAPPSSAPFSLGPSLDWIATFVAR